LTPLIILWIFESPSGFQLPKWESTWECVGSFLHTLPQPGSECDSQVAPSACTFPCPCFGSEPKVRVVTFQLHRLLHTTINKHFQAKSLTPLDSYGHISPPTLTFYIRRIHWFIAIKVDLSMSKTNFHYQHEYNGSTLGLCLPKSSTIQISSQMNQSFVGHSMWKNSNFYVLSICWECL
jgi:hypothetical protein